MKKFLSCVLALALVFSLMSVTVFATDSHPTTNHDGTAGSFAVVGTHGQNNNLNDGVGFNDASGSGTSDITVNFNGQVDGDGDNQGGGNGGTNSTIINKYAIDITYKALVIDLTEIPNDKQITTTSGRTYTVTTTYTWDVNKYVYVPVVTTEPAVEDEDEAEVEAATVLTDPITIADAYYITNHSDLPVYYKSALTNTYDTSMTMTLKNTDDDAETGAGFYMVDRATAGTYVSDTNITPGSARKGKTHYIEAAPVTDWLTTINELASTVSNGDAVGSITINFAATTGGAEATDYTA
jgi:hypothetical protein